MINLAEMTISGVDHALDMSEQYWNDYFKSLRADLHKALRGMRIGSLDIDVSGRGGLGELDSVVAAEFSITGNIGGQYRGTDVEFEIEAEFLFSGNDLDYRDGKVEVVVCPDESIQKKDVRKSFDAKNKRAISDWIVKMIGGFYR